MNFLGRKQSNDKKLKDGASTSTAGTRDSNSVTSSGKDTRQKRGLFASLKSSTSSSSGEKQSNKGPESSSTNSSSSGPATSLFRVTVPEGIQPGQEFQVYAGGRIVRVRLPPGTEPGQSLQITVPVDETNKPTKETSTKNGNSRTPSESDVPPDSDNVEKVDNGAYMVTIPDGIKGGQQFPVTIQGQLLMVTAPMNTEPGTKVRIVPPPPAAPNSSSFDGSDAGRPEHHPKKEKEEEATQLFEVEVPPGVEPGKPFALLAGGVRVLVTCPLNALPGARIRFKLPLALTQKRAKPTNEFAAIKLSYDKDGWTRTIRVSDMKFQWVRMNDKGDVDNMSMKGSKFSIEKSAYVRKLDFFPGVDERLRDGVLSLVAASEATVDSRVLGNNREVLVTYSDIANAQVKSFDEKIEWFHDKIAGLLVEWNEGHMRINIRRSRLLQDSVDAVMSLHRKDIRKSWRFDFIGEAGIDAGGLAREWFQLVTEAIFDPDMGLWQSSSSNQMMMIINPASKFIHDDYLVYYRFLGRVMGKALFDHQLVSGHMVHFIYKHILGWPITFKDIEAVDPEVYNNLKQLQQMVDAGEDLSMLCLDFTVSQEMMGANEEIELIPGGADITLENTNLPEYLEASLKYRMVEKVKPQLNELLLGFFDVIPEPLLTIFDFQELELLMCGLPEIDLEDWKAHTDYSGDFDGFYAAQYDALPPPCIWFWEVVAEFDQELKARLLQFVTGTAGVPSRGFSSLQGNDGNVRKFTIHGVSMEVCLYPRSHTCFNRIDLPRYESKDDLREKLKLAVTMASTGFEIE